PTPTTRSISPTTTTARILAEVLGDLRFLDDEYTVSTNSTSSRVWIQAPNRFALTRIIAGLESPKRMPALNTSARCTWPLLANCNSFGPAGAGGATNTLVLNLR